MPGFFSRVKNKFPTITQTELNQKVAAATRNAEETLDLVTTRHENFVSDIQEMAAASQSTFLGPGQFGLDQLINLAALQSTSIQPNIYNTHKKQVDEIYCKFKSLAKWGNQIANRILNLRAAFTMGTGIEAMLKDTPQRIEDGDEEATPDTVDNQDEQVEQVEPTGPTDEEMNEARVQAEIAQNSLDFVNDIIAFNGWDGPGADEMAVLAGIEGQLLLILHDVFDDDTGELVNYAIECLSWRKTQYKVTFNEVDGRQMVSAGVKEVNWLTNPDDASSQKVTVSGDRCVLLLFNAAKGDEEGVPYMATVLTDMEDFDRNHRVWVKMNSLHATPTPVMKFNDPASALKQKNNDDAGKRKWGIGRILYTSAEFMMAEMTGEGHLSLKAGIEELAKVISAATGIPLQFIGYANLMSNRSTADNTMEPVAVTSESEREVWVAGINKLMDKGIRRRNARSELSAPAMEEGLVTASIPFVSTRDLNLLEKVLMPSTEKGFFPEDVFLDLLPLARFRGDDLVKRLAKQREKREATTSATMSNLFGGANFDDNATSQSQAAARDTGTDFSANNAPA